MWLKLILLGGVYSQDCFKRNPVTGASELPWTVEYSEG